MGFLEDALNYVLKKIAESLRKFVSYSMILFALGMFYGYYVPTFVTKFSVESYWFLSVPVFLALLAYVSTEVAAIIFLALLFLMLIVFL